MPSFLGAIKPFIKILSASVFGQLFLFFIIPIVTRLYDAEDFGYFASAFAVTSVVSIGISGRLELCLPIIKQQSHANLLLKFCSTILYFGALFLAISIVLFFLIVDSNLPTNVMLMYFVIPISVYSIGLFRLNNFYAIREQAYTTIALTKFRQNIVNGLSQIVLGATYFSSPGLLLSHTLAQYESAIRLKKSIGYDSLKISKYKEKKIRVILIKFRRFPKYDLPAALIDNVSAQLPNLVFAWLFSPLQAGIYMMAERLLFTPVSMIAQSASQVYLGKISKRIDIFNLSILLFLAMSVLSVFLVMTIILIPENLYVSLLGSEWKGIHLYVYWLGLAAACQLVFSPLSMLFVVTEAQTYNLITQLSLLTLKVISVFYGYLSSDIMFAVKWSSISTLLVYSIVVVFLLYRSKKYDFKDVKKCAE